MLHSWNAIRTRAARFFDKSENSLRSDESETRSGGFDNPLIDEKYDLLGREAVTNHVYSYLTNLDAEWSVRVGLIAPWGAGKTTIGEWVAARAIKEGHIPVWWRDPWTAKTDAELWLGFYTALTTALSNQGIEFKSSIKHVMASISDSGWAKKAGEVHNYTKAGLGFVQALTRITSEDINKLKIALDGKRVIVIVDDLDRVDAALIPRLLMSLRGVMDIRGFSFLLPFDDRVVSEALRQHIQSDGYGERFLEKILDYRVYLTPPSERQRTTFFLSELKRYCPFIKTESLDGLDTYIPSNPRKLKALARGLRLFQSEGERHKPEEIDWKAVIFAQMIKMESEPFFQLFEEDTFGKKENRDPIDVSAHNPWMHADIDKDKSKAQEIEKARLDGLLDKAAVKVPETRKRLIEVCEGWRVCQGYWNQHKISYALKLLEAPETLTWAEFDKFWTVWSQNKNFSDLTPLISEHAKRMKKTEIEIADEFIKTLIQQYDLYLEKAATVTLQRDHRACIDNAEAVLELLDILADEGFPAISQEKILTFDTFEKIFGVCSKWAHFTGNAADRRLRDKEVAFLQKWARKVNETGDSSNYAIFIKESRRSGFDKNETLKLRKDVFSIFDFNDNDRALEILQKNEGIAGLFPYDAGIGVKDKLLDAKSNLWNPKKESPLLKLLTTADKNPVVQLNARELLVLIQHVSNEGTWGLERNQIEEFYKNPDLIEAIWNAAIVTPFQFGALSHMRDIRKYLISKGIDEKYLPTPEWLLAEKDDDGEGASQKVHAAE